MGMLEDWNIQVAKGLNTLFQNESLAVMADDIVAERPPKKNLGDLAFPMFSFSKVLRQSPVQIAAQLKGWFDENVAGCRVEAVGPYLNLFIDLKFFAKKVLFDVLAKGDEYGHLDLLKNKKMMIEFSCPNTNKPLHLGHLRNDSLGESISRILKAAGAEVEKVNLINNRGVHICKSMLAYQVFGNGITPQSENIKSDHFVGNYYVKYDQWSKQDETAEPQVREMLVKWEQGDKETMELWQKMNDWTLSGINETYKNTGIAFDRVYYESETYKLGKEQVQKGLNSGVFYKDDEGTVWVDLEDIGLDKKVLQRKDGTSLYLTQDLGTAIARHEDFPFDTMVYVVASEQQYHFKVLFHVLKLLGNQWADQLYHLSYGMVNLPDGKMKSREGTVVDADDLFAELSRLAEEEIISKGREMEVANVKSTSEAIALGALNYYLLATTPTKDMIFNPKETIAFQGSTGPYAQYMGARISSIIRKFKEQEAAFSGIEFDGALLGEEDERFLVKSAAGFPNLVKMAAEQKNPSLVISYLYEICKTFSRYYHDHSILNNEDKKLVVARMTLCQVVLQLIKNCFALTGIPFLERM